MGLKINFTTPRLDPYKTRVTKILIVRMELEKTQRHLDEQRRIALRMLCLTQVLLIHAMTKYIKANAPLMTKALYQASISCIPNDGIEELKARSEGVTTIHFCGKWFQTFLRQFSTNHAEFLIWCRNYIKEEPLSRIFQKFQIFFPNFPQNSL